MNKIFLKLYLCKGGVSASSVTAIAPTIFEEIPNYALRLYSCKGKQCSFKLKETEPPM